MKTLLIDEVSGITAEGALIHFNQNVSLNNMLPSNEWWVSWDKIGMALLPDKYCDAADVHTRRDIRLGVK